MEKLLSSTRARLHKDRLNCNGACTDQPRRANLGPNLVWMVSKHLFTYSALVWANWNYTYLVAHKYYYKLIEYYGIVNSLFLLGQVPCLGVFTPHKHMSKQIDIEIRKREHLLSNMCHV